jgi:hypothetical protein
MSIGVSGLGAGLIVGVVGLLHLEYCPIIFLIPEPDVPTNPSDSAFAAAFVKPKTGIMFDGNCFAKRLHNRGGCSPVDNLDTVGLAIVAEADSEHSVAASHQLTDTQAKKFL